MPPEIPEPDAMAPEPKSEQPTATHVAQQNQDTTLTRARKVTTRYEPENDRERALDQKINRKFDLLVTTPISLGWMFITIDKSNIGYVATGSFIQDANVTPNAVGFALTLFSTTYVPFHLFNTVFAFIIGPRLFISLQLLCCGVLSSSHAAINGNPALIALRVFLGIFEAGYNPASLFLMSQFYPRRYLGLRMGIFTSMFALAGASSGGMTYGLQSVKSNIIKGWQLVFLVQGILPILNALAVFLMVPQRIRASLLLTEEEKEHAIFRMKVDKGEITPQGTEQVRETRRRCGLSHFTGRDFTDVIFDLKKVLTIIFGICIITSMNAFPAFLPVLVQGMGFEGNTANAMSVSPFLSAIVLQIISTKLSDKYMVRGYAIAASSLGAAVFAIVMAAVDNNAVRYVAMHFCVSLVMISGSLISVWLANNTPGSGAKSFVLGLNGLTHFGGIIAGQLFNVKWGPKYKVPLFIAAVLLIIGGLGMLVPRYIYDKENKRRKQITAQWTEDDFAVEKVSIARRGDQRLDFQYTL